MKLMDAMHTYFQGEKIEALVFILPLGLLSIVFGAWLLSDNPGSSMRGVAIPCVVMGLVMTVVGAVVGYRTPAQVERLEAAVEAAPASALAEERTRMDKVNQGWPIYLAVWAAFGVVGLGLRFGTRGDFTQGLGISLVLFCGVCLVVDGFAERRTHPWTAALDTALAETVPPAAP